MIKNKNFWYYFVLIFVFFLFIFSVNNKFLSNFKYLKIADTVLKVEVVSTPQKQTLGLSGRKNLKEDEGMLFVFGHTAQYAFWMKDMNFSIDMIWMDENMKIIYIKKNATPESYPEAFGPTQNSLYVLEVVSSFADKHNLKVGDSVSFQ